MCCLEVEPLGQGKQFLHLWNGLIICFINISWPSTGEKSKAYKDRPDVTLALELTLNEVRKTWKPTCGNDVKRLRSFPGTRFFHSTLSVLRMFLSLSIPQRTSLHWLGKLLRVSLEGSRLPSSLPFHTSPCHHTPARYVQLPTKNTVLSKEKGFQIWAPKPGTETFSTPQPTWPTALALLSRL